VEGDPLAALDQALAVARQGYQEEVAAALEACDAELAAALPLAPGPDMTTAMQKAIRKLKITGLDRHDQYEAEVRAALRKALLAAVE
jgi:hypothetical protein